MGNYIFDFQCRMEGKKVAEKKNDTLILIYINLTSKAIREEKNKFF